MTEELRETLASNVNHFTEPTNHRDQPALDVTLTYHQHSRHFPFRFAPSLGYMDWETQPDPFRRFEGVRIFPLGFEPVGPLPLYEPAFVLGQVNPAPLNLASVAQLFYDALALSAWKEIQNARWPLRVNPSSGNLHPTEGYLVGGPIPGLHDKPAVYHYAPLIHALEHRVELSIEVWRAISAQLPKNTLLVGLTSIHWRESWKYGERAFRYCHHDVGHAIACVSVAAAGLGWDTRLLEGVIDEDLATLLGTHVQTGVEAEHPDCLIAVFPQSGCLEPKKQQSFRLKTGLVTSLRAARWMGRPNTLSRDHHDWQAIDEVAAATEKHAPPSNDFWSSVSHPNDSLELQGSRLSLRSIIHQRRSAVGLDGRTGITRKAFYQILLKTMPGSNQIPFTTLPWHPCVDLLLFVHRVVDLPPGLYVLLRDPSRESELRNAMESSFLWHRPDGCPSSIPLFFLVKGDVRDAAQQTSCDQAIAADGAFAVAMLAEYRKPLGDFGSWFYRRLYWETGVVGQVLYLEAEAAGIRGTGIGCFFDDLTHRVFGLEGDRFQVLYHFTMGVAVDDPRLRTHPPYQHLARDECASETSTEL
jgi:SagB-type dehydrogenase family enzyme